MTFEPLPPSDSAFTATSGWTIRRPNARTPIATLVACAACLVVWAILTLGPHASIPERLSWFGAGPPTDLWDGRPWGLVTSAFVHLEPWHVAFNVYWIWRLGSVLEDLVGAARWIAFCVLAALVSSAAEVGIGGDAGIGGSGVCYALFGLVWAGRDRVRAFAAALPDRIVWLFLTWLVLCFVLTYTNVVPVGNWAHLGGLAFGAAVGASRFARRAPVWTGAAAGALVAAAAVVAVWCPWQWAWAGAQALRAHRASDFAAAETWYRRSRDLGADPVWIAENLALIHASQGRAEDAARDLSDLRDADAGRARAFEASADWGTVAASAAYRRNDFAEALRFYEQSRAGGADPGWCWSGITRSQLALGRMDAARKSFAELRRIDRHADADLEPYFAK